ncbi:hypothetical protein MMC14_002684 [Varicellaria rhodocarpa]|nr:hypothetical protein [Varicellaria rhodocarpa]
MGDSVDPPKQTIPPSDTSTFVAADHAHDGKYHLLLAASGSVATIKIPHMVHALSNHPHLSIRIIFTKSAENFLSGQSVEQPALGSLIDIRNVDSIHLDEDEWKKPWTRGGAILHIELRRWSHMLVIAPLSANTMAKMTVGIADNLLLSVVRAWDTTGEIEGNGEVKRIIIAPAMNTAMWRQPVSKKQLKVLEDEWGIAGNCQGGWIEVLRPVKKELACGDVGSGAMREWNEIVRVIWSRIDRIER